MESNEIWYEIPGFSKYQISDGCRVRIKKTGAYKKYNNIRGVSSNLYVVLQPDEGGKVRISVARILFAAINSINPREIPSNFICSFGGKSHCKRNLTVMERCDLLSLIGKTSNQRRVEYIRGGYERCLRMCRLAIDKDIPGLYAFIEGYRAELLSIIKRYVAGEKNIRNTFDSYVNYMINGIVEERILVLDIISYTKAVFRKYVRRRDREIDVGIVLNRKERLYFDDRKYE